MFSQFDANGAPGCAKNAHIKFRGTKGTLYLGSRSIEVVPTPVRTVPIPASDPTNRKVQVEETRKTHRECEPIKIAGDMSSAHHARDFLDGVKTRKSCHFPVEVGHRSTTATLIAAIAQKRKRYLTWDADAERFTNDTEANALLSYEYRSPWKLPG